MSLVITEVPGLTSEEYKQILEAVEEAKRYFKEIDLLKGPEATEERERRWIFGYGQQMCMYLLKELGKEEFIRRFGGGSLKEAFFRCVLGAMTMADREGGDEYKFNYITKLTDRIVAYAEKALRG